MATLSLRSNAATILLKPRERESPRGPHIPTNPLTGTTGPRRGLTHRLRHPGFAQDRAGRESGPAGTGHPNHPETIGGEGPIGAVGTSCYLAAMNPLLLILVLILLFGGGGFYVGGPYYGGGGVGLILLVCLIIFLFGGFRTTKN